MKKTIWKKIIIALIIIVTISSCRFLFSRKTPDAINNPQALEYFKKAYEQSDIGEEGIQNAIDLLNKADSLEPKNSIIIQERGLMKFNSKLDVRGAFEDMTNSIAYSKDERNISSWYYNRGLCFMEICDIKSACADWSKAGKLGDSNMEKYCRNCSDTIFQGNKNGNIEVVFELIDESAFITSTHNPPSMSECMARITVKNINNADLIVYGTSLDYGLSEDSCSMYFEAQLQNGEEFIFFTNSTYSYYPVNKVMTVKKGESFSQEQDITFLHQFPYPGIYKVRIALRPSVIFQGIATTYYSNWQTLRVE